MLQSVSMPLCAGTREEYRSWSALRKELRKLGLDGIEGIWGGEDIPSDFPQDLLTGYHLTFYPDWLDFYREDYTALKQKFGNLDAVREFYGGTGAEILIKLYQDDLARAIALGASYVVFHVSDVSIEEGYTYRWLHTDEDVLDASAEIINILLDGVAADFDFLVENQWWPGFTFTEPKKTARLMDKITYPHKGILLDTGHLMNTNMNLTTQAEGLEYIHAMLDLHGSLSSMIRGVHLHQSISGSYVSEHTGKLPHDLPDEYIRRFGVSYEHILKIDQHLPWTDDNVAALLERISPRYVTHELTAAGYRERLKAVQKQMQTIARGGKQIEP